MVNATGPWSGEVAARPMLGPVVDTHLGAPQLERQRDQPRLRSVVQVALDAPELCGLRIAQASQNRLKHDFLLDVRRARGCTLPLRRGQPGDQLGVAVTGQG